MTRPMQQTTFAPQPGAAPLRRMLAAQTALEMRMLLRNGEQLLLTVVIPVLVLVVFSSIEVMDLGTRAARVDFLVPGVLALAVMSTAFTGLAIGTGFERRYGVLKRLGASPLPRSGLLAAKATVGARHRGAPGAAADRGRAAARLGARTARGRRSCSCCSPAPPRSARWPC